MMEDFIVLHYLFLYGVNFYMSYMTCLFLILWYLLYPHKNVKEFLTNGFRFAGYSLLSGAMAAVVLLPAYLGICRHPQPNYNFQKNYGMEHLEICFPDIFLGQHRLRWR